MTQAVDLRPHIEVEVGTVPVTRVRWIRNFVLVEDAQQLSDPCSFDLPNDEGQYTIWLSYRHLPITVWVCDPAVNQGRPVRRLKGVISDVEQIVQEGSVVRVVCYDLGWHLAGSCVRTMLNVRTVAQDGTEGGLSLYALAQFLLTDSYFFTDPKTGQTQRIPGQTNWGFEGIIGYNPAAPRQGLIDKDYEIAAAAARGLHLDFGRLGQQIALHPNPYQITPIIQTETGETVAEVLLRYAGLVRCLVGVDPLGYLCLYRPDYSTPPAYGFFHCPPSDPLHLSNNVIASRYRLSGDSVYTEVRCYSTVIESTYAPQTSNPNEGRLFGQYLAPGAAVAGAPSSEISRPLPLRRLTFADSERYNPERARARALWRWQQGIFAAASLTYKVQGISQGGKLYTTNVQAEARDGYNGLDRTMFVSRVELRQDESGTSTVVTLKPSGLYFA